MFVKVEDAMRKIKKNGSCRPVCMGLMNNHKALSDNFGKIAPGQLKNAKIAFALLRPVIISTKKTQGNYKITDVPGNAQG